VHAQGAKRLQAEVAAVVPLANSGVKLGLAAPAPVHITVVVSLCMVDCIIASRARACALT
jgi:hypothetical protein